ncbi:MAG: ATP-binding protein [Polaribacter sp.]|jgi:signal transduction histidine kinase
MNNYFSLKDKSVRDKFLIINTAILCLSGNLIYFLTLGKVAPFLSNAVLISNFSFLVVFFVSFYNIQVGRYLNILSFLAFVVIINSNFSVGIGMAYFYIYFIIFTIFSYRKDKVIIFSLSGLTLFCWIGSTLYRIYSSNGANTYSLDLENENPYIVFSIIIILNIFSLIFIFLKLNANYEDNIQNKINKTEKLNTLKNKFLTSFSTEINETIQNIIIFSKKIKDNDTENSQYIELDALITSSKNLKNLVSNILEYDNELNQTKLVFADISSILKEKELLYDFSAKENKSTITTVIPNEFPIIKIDKFKYDLILNNLISNAIKFTENGEISIEVNYKEVENNKIVLHTSVKDTGVGISKSKIKQIFNEFSQADKNTFENYGGSGLGLFIVKNIITNMNSEIHVNSEKGKGSHFYFDLIVEKGTLT